jgi:hypothetical protein
VNPRVYPFGIYAISYPVVERVDVPASVCPRLLREEKRRARILISIGIVPMVRSIGATRSSIGATHQQGC